MLREYINELLKENDEKAQSLNAQLKDLLNDLDCAKRWLETLRMEMNIDNNIFSPRTIDDNLDEKLKDAQDNINRISQDIEYVRSFIEENLKKRQEYEKLLSELDVMETDYLIVEKAGSENQGESESPVNDLKKFGSFLSELYKKTEICLSSLYNDRIKCKNELKSMKSMISNMLALIAEENHK